MGQPFDKIRINTLFTNLLFNEKEANMAEEMISEESKNSNMWAMLCHLTALAAVADALRDCGYHRDSLDNP